MLDQLLLVSWFAFSFTVLPPRLEVGVRHTLTSKLSEAEKLLNTPGVYFPLVSVVDHGRIKPLKLVSRVEE